MKNRNVLISGASVAGPALAYWLRAYGFNPTIVERASTLRPGGYAVDFRGTALAVLDRMGVLEQIRAHHTGMGDAALIGRDGRQYATLPAAVFAGDLEVLKGDLTRILYDAGKDGVTYRFGDSITAINQSADCVLVSFENAAPEAFDLVIGADGLHSNVRRLVFGPEERLIRHLGCYVAIFSTDNYLGLDHTGQLYAGPGKAANLFSGRHNTEARAAFYFQSEPLQYDHRDVDQQRRIVAEAYAGEGWEVPRLLQRMATATDFYFDSVSQIHLDRWSSGRIALLGDAGYAASPLSGRGTSQALVAAYVLAGELAMAAGDHQQAFPAYETRLRDYVADNQQAGVAGAEMFFGPPPDQESLDAIDHGAGEQAAGDVLHLIDYPALASLPVPKPPTMEGL
jgi:2-polyprenyl-6-methoxyphenol hydroxylase-like FAD-dependent oxidoreductase